MNNFSSNQHKKNEKLYNTISSNKKKTDLRTLGLNDRLTALILRLHYRRQPECCKALFILTITLM